MTIRSMHHLAATLLAAALGLPGCGNDRDPSVAADLLAPGLAGGPGAPARARSRLPIFDPADFVSRVDNPYFPLVPGAVHTYVGDTEEGVETTEAEVLHTTKVILGIATTVVRDRVYLNGSLIEDTFDWYAQDREGNVWYLGEDVKNYENGVLVSTTGSWEAGKDGATAGIIMEARPRIGDSYPQEHAEGVAEDAARVLSLSKTVSVPFGTFEQCLQTEEWTPLEPGARQFKYYARGVGLVLELSRHGGRQRVELISISSR
jgi:hypothetical protein